MSFECQFNDLFSVPFGDQAGIYWLRFFRAGNRGVAVVTEVPGNPSFSVSNGISRIALSVAQRFDVHLDNLTVFEIWPRGSMGEPTTSSIKRVAVVGEIRWTDSSRAEIEALVGASLPALPGNDELRSRVIANGGEIVEEARRLLFEAFAVSDLPPPHNPSRCQHLGRFRSIQGANDLIPEGWFEADLAAGRRFLDSLTDKDLRRCRFHDADWTSIADESVRIILDVGTREADDHAAVARQSPLNERERQWLASLFSDPIVISNGSYVNGQHRGCALRFSGARCAAIGTGYESLGEIEVAWEYEGDG